MSTTTEFEYQVRIGLDAVYRKFPKLKRSIAQDKAIIEACNRFVGDGRQVAPTADLYALAIEQSYSEPENSKTFTPHDYIAHFQVQQEQQSVAALEQANRAVWDQILSIYDVASHDANFNMVRSYCNGEITLPKFEFLVANTPQGFNLDWSDEREKILIQILELLHDPYGRRMSPFDLKQQRSKMSHWNRQQLRARLSELQTKQAKAKKSASELKADLAATRKAQEGDRPYPGWPTLLSTLVPRGQIQAVNTREYLNHITKHDFETFKHMVKIYGSQQVDDIRLGRRY